MGKVHWGVATLLIFVAVFFAIVSADEYIAKKNYYLALKKNGGQ